MGSGDSGNNYKEEFLTVALHDGVSRRHSKLGELYLILGNYIQFYPAGETSSGVLFHAQKFAPTLTKQPI